MRFATLRAVTTMTTTIAARPAPAPTIIGSPFKPSSNPPRTKKELTATPPRDKHDKAEESRIASVSSLYILMQLWRLHLVTEDVLRHIAQQQNTRIRREVAAPPDRANKRIQTTGSYVGV